MHDSLLAYAGWCFFALWSLAVGAISLSAFGRELIPSQIRVEPRNDAIAQQHERYSEFLKR